MTQTAQVLDLFHRNGNRLTLGQILQTSLSAEYRKHFSLLRKQGYRIEVKLNRERPSENLYTMEEPVRYRFEQGQGVLFGEAI